MVPRNRKLRLDQVVVVVVVLQARRAASRQTYGGRAVQLTFEAS